MLYRWTTEVWPSLCLPFKKMTRGNRKTLWTLDCDLDIEPLQKACLFKTAWILWKLALIKLTGPPVKNKENFWWEKCKLTFIWSSSGNNIYGWDLRANHTTKQRQNNITNDNITTTVNNANKNNNAANNTSTNKMLLIIIISVAIKCRVGGHQRIVVSRRSFLALDGNLCRDDVSKKYWPMDTPRTQLINECNAKYKCIR